MGKLFLEVFMRQLNTACGHQIVIPFKAEEHLRAHPDVASILEEAVGRIHLPTDGSFLETVVEMGRIVGRSGCIETSVISLDDTVLFAQRIGRPKPSRMVYGEGAETSKIVVLAFPDRNVQGNYVLVTSWVGGLVTKEPWDTAIRSEVERAKCVAFWCTHALVYDPTVAGVPFESTWNAILAS